MSGSRTPQPSASTATDLTHNQIALVDAMERKDIRAAITLLAIDKTDPNFNMVGVSFLSSCIIQGDTQFVKLLINNGADINSGSLMPPLFAAIQDDLSMAKILLSLPGIEIEQRNMMGTTPLMIAADKGNLAAVQLLLERGANPKATDQYKLTAADYARKKKHAEVATYLEAAAATSTLPSAPAATSGSMAAIMNAMLDPLMLQAFMQQSKDSEAAHRVMATGLSASKVAADKADRTVASHIATHGPKVDAEAITAPLFSAAAKEIEAAAQHEMEKSAQKIIARSAALYVSSETLTGSISRSDSPPAAGAGKSEDASTPNP